MKSLLPKATEREIQNSILHLLAAHRIYALRINTGAGWANGRPVQHHSGGSGVADIVAFPRWMDTPWGVWVDGLPSVLWIEVKTEKGRQSPEQRSFEEHVKGFGMFYLLARSVEDVAEWIKFHQ